MLIINMPARFDDFTVLPLFTPEQNAGRFANVALQIKATAGSEHPVLTDPDIYAPYKRFGALFLHCMDSPVWFRDRATGFSLEVGDPSVILNIPPKRQSKNNTPENPTQFLEATAYFISTHNLQPKCLWGVTHQRLGAVAARRYGFHAKPLNSRMPTLENRIASAYRKGGLKGDPGRMTIIYQQTGDFMQRFGSVG